MTFGIVRIIVVSALTTPPEETLSAPELPTDVPLAMPPEDTFIVPPLPTDVPLSVPLVLLKRDGVDRVAAEVIVPPLTTDAWLSAPPKRTDSRHS